MANNDRENLKAKLGRVVHGDYHAVHGWDTPATRKMMKHVDEYTDTAVTKAQREMLEGLLEKSVGRTHRDDKDRMVTVTSIKNVLSKLGGE